jgi:hypothetical protein
MSFLAKLALAKVNLRGVGQAERTDEKLGEIIRNFSYDEHEVASKRKLASRNFRTSLDLINRVNNRKEALVKEGDDLKKYLALIKRQIKDIVKIIRLTKSLIEDEDLQLLYDVRAALSVLEEFVSALKENLKGFEINRQDRNKLESIAREIDNSFGKLLNDLQAGISKIYQYLRSTGYKTEASPTQEIDLGTFVRDRTRVRRQVTGKVVYIRRKITELITQLKKVKQSSDDKEKISYLIQYLGYFNKQFSGLVDFSLSRGEISVQVILSSITLQKKYLNDLLELRTELERFEELIKRSRSDDKKNKLKEEQQILQREVDEIEKELNQIKDTEGEEKKYLRLEARYGRRVKRGISRIARSIAAGVALTVIVGASVGHIKSDSMAQTMRADYQQQMEASTLKVQEEQHKKIKDELAEAGVEVSPKKINKVLKQKAKVAILKKTDKTNDLKQKVKTTILEKETEKKKVAEPNLVTGELNLQQLESFSNDVVDLVKSGAYKKVWTEFFPQEDRLILFGKNKDTGNTEALFVYWARGGTPEKRIKRDKAGKVIDVFIPTPKGNYTLGKNEFKAKHGWSKWPGARVPYGADLKEIKTAYSYEFKGNKFQFVDIDVEAEYKKGKWKKLTGPDTFGKKSAGSKSSLWTENKGGDKQFPLLTSKTYLILDPSTGKAIGGTKSFISSDGTPKKGVQKYYVELPSQSERVRLFVEVVDPDTGAPKKFAGGFYDIKCFSQHKGKWYKTVFSNDKFYEKVNGKHQLYDYYLSNVYGRGVYNLKGAVYFHSTSVLEKEIYKKYKNGWLPISVLDKVGGGYSHGCVHAVPGFMEMIQKLNRDVKIKVHGGKTKIVDVLSKYKISPSVIGLAKKSGKGFVITQTFVTSMKNKIGALAKARSNKNNNKS